MAEQLIRFEDGAVYERGMGAWSRLVGAIFLDWVAPSPGLRWIDIGCGNGAFSQLIVDNCAPAELHGIDPSDAQLAFARSRPAARAAQFEKGDAMALPFPDDRFDAAVMALVIPFVPVPARGVAEMVRVVRPGGRVAAYTWDMVGDGMPVAPIQQELRRLGVEPPLPPSAAVSGIDAIRELWIAAGLEDVEAREIRVSRTFPDFEDFWSLALTSGGLGPVVAGLAPGDAGRLRDAVRTRLPAGPGGRITGAGRANAVKGRVPA